MTMDSTPADPTDQHKRCLARFRVRSQTRMYEVMYNSRKKTEAESKTQTMRQMESQKTRPSPLAGYPIHTRDSLSHMLVRSSTPCMVQRPLLPSQQNSPSFFFLRQRICTKNR